MGTHGESRTSSEYMGCVASTKYKGTPVEEIVEELDETWRSFSASNPAPEARVHSNLSIHVSPLRTTLSDSGRSHEEELHEIVAVQAAREREAAILRAENEAEKLAAEAATKQGVCDRLRESIVAEEDVLVLRGLVQDAETSVWAGHCLLLAAEVLNAKQRLVQHRAQCKAAEIEQHVDLYESMQTAAVLQECHHDPTQENLENSTDACQQGAPHKEREGASRCVVCLDAAPTHVVIPCGHQCICEDCAIALAHAWQGQCPLCRVYMQSALRVYKS